MDADELSPSLEEMTIYDKEIEGELCEDKLWEDVEEHLPEHPFINPLDTFRYYISSVLSKIIGIDLRIVFPLLQRARTLGDGDILLPVRQLGLGDITAEDIVAFWIKQIPSVGLMERPVAHGEFVRFTFNTVYLLREIITMILEESFYGHNPLLGLKDAIDPFKGRKKIVIEFSSPSIAKKFLGGHLRSTIIGGFLSNLYEQAGWEVVRLNYLGDWGKEYGLLGVGLGIFANQTRLEEDPIPHLYDVLNRTCELRDEEQMIIEDSTRANDDTKTKIAADVEKRGLDARARLHFEAMCEGDTAETKMWKWYRDLCIWKYTESYARLNIGFNNYMGESLVSKRNMEAVSTLMDDKRLTEPSDGSIIVDFSKHLEGSRGRDLGIGLVRKGDGTSEHLTRDMGALFDHETGLNFDKMIYVVAPGRELRLRQLFEVLKLTGKTDLLSRISLVTFGHVITNGEIPRGPVRFLDDIFREISEIMHDVMKKEGGNFTQGLEPGSTADILGISCIVVQDLSGRLTNDYFFDTEAMTSFSHDTGAHLQYSHAQLCAVIRDFPAPTSELHLSDFTLLTQQSEIDLVRLLVQFPEIIIETMNSQEPCNVLAYLFGLICALKKSYSGLVLIEGDEHLDRARKALYVAVRRVLKNGMQLLGLTPIESM